MIHPGQCQQLVGQPGGTITSGKCHGNCPVTLLPVTCSLSDLQLRVNGGERGAQFMRRIAGKATFIGQ